MEIKIIRKEVEYKAACERLYELLLSPEAESQENPDGDEMDILAMLIEQYEKEHYPVGQPDPIEAIKFRMDQMGLKQKDIAPLFGGKTRVSEVLNRKRPLSIKMIILLNRVLGIPIESLTMGNRDVYLKKEDMEIVMEHPSVRNYLKRNPGNPG